MKTIEQNLTATIIVLTVFIITFLAVILRHEDEISIRNAEILAAEEGRSFGRNKEYWEKYRREHDYKVYMDR